jgi:hypothetical protein
MSEQQLRFATDHNSIEGQRDAISRAKKEKARAAGVPNPARINGFLD